MFDASCHGNERSTSELIYSYAKWLLEETEPIATRILQEKLTLIIPITNMDGFPSHRKNMNFTGCDPSEVTTPYSCGVDLNRNHNWQWCEYCTTGCAGVGPPCNSKDDPTHPNYCGPFPNSEPETLVVQKAWAKYRPTHYVNLHCCGFGPIWYSQDMSAPDKNYISEVIGKYTELANERGQPIPTVTECGGAGCFDCAPYHWYHIYGWSMEVMAGGTPYEEIETTVLGNWLPFFTTLSLEAQKPQARLLDLFLPLSLAFLILKL